MSRWLISILWATAATAVLAAGPNAPLPHAPSLATPSVSPAVVHAPIKDPDLAIVRSLLEQPENQIDLTRAKLTIDRIIDPSIDIEANVAMVDAMAATENRIILPGTNIWTKMQTLRQFLYEAGPWNDNAVFRYDFDDPKGRKLENKLLSHYLAARKGQCVSMPTLFLILAQKMGMEAALAQAPNHQLVMLKADDSTWLNLETTGNGSPTRLETYQRQSPMSQKALENGVYMRPLSRKETVATMTEELLQFYETTGRFEQLIAMADLALQYHPQDVGILLYKSFAYEDMVRRDFMATHRTSNDIPENLKVRFNQLASLSMQSRQRAIELGVLPLTRDGEAAYDKKVAQAKSGVEQRGTP